MSCRKWKKESVEGKLNSINKAKQKGKEYFTARIFRQ